MKSKNSIVRVIINADDLGLSLDVNRRIEEAIIAGAITSSTIMANGPAFDDAVRIAKQYPHISFGVHLNIIEFKPLTDSAVFNKYRMLNANGEFLEGAIYAVQEIGDDLKEAVRKEFDLQIEKVKDSGIIISHLDSHQHTHTIYAFKKVMYSLMKKHHIDKIRRCLVPSVRLMLWGYKGQAIKLDKSKAVTPKRRSLLWRRIHLFIVKSQCAKWIRFFCSSSKITDGFYAYHTVCENWNLLSSRINGRCVELMCHPGHPAYEYETRMVFNKELERHADITYISYNEL